MTYSVKELFRTLQGEGYHAGRPAVFCRFSGCNLWSGREVDRASAVCTFCDTDFVGTDGTGGGKFVSADALAQAVADCWEHSSSANRFVVFTGGEPLLQIDPALIEAVHRLGFEIAVETNGTVALVDGIDWVCVSPKANAPLNVTKGHELKLVFPQREHDPQVFAGLDFRHFWLQPMDGPERQANTDAAVAYCLDHPRWRLSIQTHKLIGIA